jgi:hypothetical protein
MHRILKYKLQVIGEQRIALPVGAIVLSVQFQFGYLELRAIVNCDLVGSESRFIRLFATGEYIESPLASLQYISTVQQDNGHLIWHVFEQV